MALSLEDQTALVEKRIKTLCRRKGACPTRDEICEDLWSAGIDVEARFVGERIFLLGIYKEIPDPPEKFSQLTEE